MKSKIIIIGFSVLISMFIVPMLWAQKYEHSFTELEKYKAPIDDPAPFYKNTEGFKKIMPPDVYKKVTYDVDTMKKAWAEVVGFKAPDVVGKVFPEITPGKYTLEDKKKYPFEKLMWKHLYDRFNPTPKSGARHVGNFTEFEIVPTRQYYHSLPVIEATKKYMGAAKQNSQGYLNQESYIAGLPFPRPSGPHMAQQIMYNWDKSYYLDNEFYWEHVYGYTKDLRNDYEGLGTAYTMRHQGRVKLEPMPWLDKRAQDLKEQKSFQYMSFAPRDIFGNIINITSYMDPDRFDLFLMYINSLRRVRRMTASDTQDPAVGQDIIYEDWQGFNQKLTPKRYPYKYEVIGEGEFLVPISWDGSTYMNTKEGYILKNLQMERRPIWVVQLTQLDKNYIYSRRIFYIDKETFYYHSIHNYDQKGRLYRTFDVIWGFIPEMGTYNQFHVLALDHVDIHSTAYHAYSYPAVWLGRDDISMKGMIKMK
jgi:hypothetical protein